MAKQVVTVEDVPVLAPGAVPLALAGPAVRALAFVSQVPDVDLGAFEAHELERLKSIALDVRTAADAVRQQVDRALWEKQHPGEAF